MFNLAVAVVAMGSALTLTSCDKLFGGSDKNSNETTITDSLSTADSNDSLNTATAEEAAETATAEATEAPESATTATNALAEKK